MAIGILGLLLTAGCAATTATTPPPPASSEAPAPTTPATSSGGTTATTEPPVASGGEWVTVRPSFESRGKVEGDPIVAEVASLHSLGGSYWALGDIAGRAAIWRSDDLNDFRITYLDRRKSPRRFLRLNSLVEFDGRLVTGGPGHVPGPNQDLDRSFMLVSADGGSSWTEIDQPFLSDPFQRLDQLVVIGDKLLAEVVNDECCGQPAWGPFITSDLDNWDPVTLPGSNSETWPAIVDDGQGSVWAIDTSGVSQTQIWSTIDGLAWDLAEEEGNTGYSYLAIDGILHALPDVPARSPVGPTGDQLNGILRLEGPDWVMLEPDSGQWGDGYLRVFSGIHNTDSGRFYGIIARVLRASVHYCYEDVTTCSHGENALVTSADGLTWRDVVRPPDAPGYWRDGHLFWTLDGSPALATLDPSSENRSTWIVHYWSGSELPPTVDPPSYPPPEVPVPYFEYELGLAVGDEVRYAWPLGSCGGVYVDDTRWRPTVDPDMRDWPIREVQVFDGPTGLAYGRLRRVAADALEFFIEGSDEIVTLVPREDDNKGLCG